MNGGYVICPSYIFDAMVLNSQTSSAQTTFTVKGAFEELLKCTKTNKVMIGAYVSNQLSIYTHMSITNTNDSVITISLYVGDIFLVFQLNDSDTFTCRRININ